MNKLIFDKDHILIMECIAKAKDCSIHWEYVFKFTKWGKRWGYYMAVARRLHKRE